MFLSLIDVFNMSLPAYITPFLDIKPKPFHVTQKNTSNISFLTFNLSLRRLTTPHLKEIKTICGVHVKVKIHYLHTQVGDPATFYRSNTRLTLDAPCTENFSPLFAPCLEHSYLRSSTPFITFRPNFDYL